MDWESLFLARHDVLFLSGTRPTIIEHLPASALESLLNPLRGGFWRFIVHNLFGHSSGHELVFLQDFSLALPALNSCVSEDIVA